MKHCSKPSSGSNMKIFGLLLWCLLTVINVNSQTTVFSDQFTGTDNTLSTNADPALTYTSNLSLTPSTTGSASITNNILQMNNGNNSTAASNFNGLGYVTASASTFKTPYKQILSQNQNTVTWTVNMRSVRSTALGTTMTNNANNYTLATILACDNADPTSAGAKGYGLFLLRATPNTSYNAVYLIYFTNGINGVTYSGTTNQTIITSIQDIYSPSTSNRAYGSFKVTYTPSGNSWQIFYRYDGTTAFTSADNTSGTWSSSTAAVNSSATNVSLNNFAFAHSFGTTTGQYAQFDNFKVTVDPSNVISYNYKGSGSLHDLTSWEDSQGANPANFTSDNQLFNIINTTSVTTSEVWTVSGSGSKIIVGNANQAPVTLTINSGNGVIGTMDIAAASGGSNSVIVKDATNIPNFGSLHATSEVHYQLNASPLPLSATYGKLYIDGTSTVTIGNSSTQPANPQVQTLFYLGSSATLTVSSTAYNSVFANIYITAGGSASINGILRTSRTGGLVTFSKASADGSNATGSVLQFQSAEIPGTTLSLTGSSIEFLRSNSGSAQIITPRNDYNNLTISDGTTGVNNKTLNGSITVAGTLTLNLTQSTLTGTGSISMNDDAIVKVTAGSFENIPFSFGSSVNLMYDGTTLVTTSNEIPTAAATLNNLTVSNSAGVRLGSNTTVNGTLSVTGALYTSGKFLTLGNSATASFGPVSALYVESGGTANFASRQVTFESSSAGTARISVIEGTVSGADNIVFQRYFPAKRAWRLITAPLSGTGSIYSNWQNNGQNISGKGILVTGQGANAATNGLDASTALSSILTYNQNTNQWQGITNTKTTNISDFNGYMVFVRGDRNTINLTPGNTSSTTIAATGSLKYADQTFTTNANSAAFTLISNPYISPVDFNAIYNDAANNTSNIQRRIFRWNANQGSSSGSYVTVNYNTVSNSYDVTPPLTNPLIIQAGEAFFVQTKTDVTGTVNQLTIKEVHKSSTVSNEVFRNGTQMEKLFINLYKSDANNDAVLEDGVLINFHNTYSRSVNSDDVIKLSGFDESLSLSRNSQLLSIEALPLADAGDTVFLNAANLKTANYKFSIDPQNFNAPDLAAYLEDTYLNTSILINLQTVTDYSFAATAGTNYSGRFRIVFKTSSTLSSNNLTVKASENNNIIKVEWITDSENGIKQYEVEKSENGISFSKVAVAPAKENNQKQVQYSWIDNTAVYNDNFYRIKSVGINNNIQYSAVVKLSISKTDKSIRIFPNPIKGNIFSIQISGAAGSYTTELYNIAGQKIYTTNVMHTGGNSTQHISIPSNLPSGNYQLRIINENGATQTATILLTK